MLDKHCDDDKTVFVGNLGSSVKEEILFELFLQAGPLERVTIARDKEGRQKSYGFVCYKHKEAVPYAIALLNGTWLYGRPIKLQYRYGSLRGSGGATPPTADGGSCSSTHPVHRAMTPYPESSVLQGSAPPSQSPSQEQLLWNMHCALPSLLCSFLPALPCSALELPQWAPPLGPSGQALPSLLADIGLEAEGQPGLRGSSEKGSKHRRRRLHEGRKKRTRRL
ncbi:RNA binding motif protein 11 isoform X2 [Paramormyrops kingsleyae]|uniref:Splicing regulator RBM11-like n=1 Tax=Paramormyrops kingsleyae TaxID=1676925 RepID=A0A3B3Q4I8_9TELE|nr:splicing regulator RBM11-like isoform X2 [Paramormyrops kingsleyae]